VIAINWKIVNIVLLFVPLFFHIIFYQTPNSP